MSSWLEDEFDSTVDRVADLPAGSLRVEDKFEPNSLAELALLGDNAWRS